MTELNKHTHTHTGPDAHTLTQTTQKGGVGGSRRRMNERGVEQQAALNAVSVSYTYIHI